MTKQSLFEKEIASSLELVLSAVERTPRNDSSHPLFRQPLTQSSKVK